MASMTETVKKVEEEDPYGLNRDFTTEIKAAADAGDYKLAAQLEQQRNAKIDYLNETDTNRWNAQKTSDYAGHIDPVDYGTVGQRQMAQGASADEVLKTYLARQEKASNTVGLEQFADDAIQKEMWDYIQANQKGSTTYTSPHVTLPEMPAFSDLTVPELPGWSQVALPEFSALSVPTAADVEISDYSGYIEEMQNALLESNLAELEGAYHQNVAALDRAAAGVDESYQAARNRSAGAAELAERNFAETANASGLNNGTGGQAALARSVTLQNNLNDLNAQEGQSLAELELQRVNIESEYNTSIAQAKAEGDYRKAELLYQEKLRVEAATVEAIQQKFTNEVTTYQLQMDQMEKEFDSQVAYQQLLMEQAQQQFDNEVTKKKLEYQALRDSVSDAKWLAEFDLAYEQWLQEVELQRQEMQFEYQQWEQKVAAQQQEMDFSRQQWENSVAVQQQELSMQQQELNAQLKQQQVENSQWQQEMEAKWEQTEVENAQWQQKFQQEQKEFEDTLELEWANQELDERKYAGAQIEANAEVKGLSYGRYLYESSGSEVYMYKKLMADGYTPEEIDAIMAELGLL